MTRASEQREYLEKVLKLLGTMVRLEAVYGAGEPMSRNLVLVETMGHAGVTAMMEFEALLSTTLEPGWITFAPMKDGQIQICLTATGREFYREAAAMNEVLRRNIWWRTGCLGFSGGALLVMLSGVSAILSYWLAL